MSALSSVSAFNVSRFLTAGMFWLLVAIVGAGLFFRDGIDALLTAWQLPEYSHGPLIPVLSGFLFLRQLKEYPPQPGPKDDRNPGILVTLFALSMGALGMLAGIDDIVAYGVILWVGGILLVSFGWNTGKHFWPGVLHLVYMLPLPGVIYFKTTNGLQLISSELGVFFLRLLDIPVFLQGNIIDLGVVKLHVADACSGLRYMFPIMSFSYIFAALYRGPTWHKAVLLLAAIPIAILMNSIRIAVAGVVVQYYGSEWLEGFTHFFEGWIIFVICILLLFLLAWVMVRLRRDNTGLTDALDLDTDGLGEQVMRVTLVQPSKALITVAFLGLAGFGAFAALPERGNNLVEREAFISFPRELGGWQQDGPRQFLSAAVTESLGADDYHQVSYQHPGRAAPVGLFMAWYNDQSDGGVHSPEVCLPGSGWEIAWLERTDITQVVNDGSPFALNRAIIEKGEARVMVYYWFQQKDRRIARDYVAKFQLMLDGVRTGRTDGAMVRLTTAIRPGESDEAAEARLQDILTELFEPLPRFIPLE